MKRMKEEGGGKEGQWRVPYRWPYIVLCERGKGST